MALKIKKVILNDKGQVVEELEGTEAEIEAYERKQSKKNETVGRKKELLKDEIRRMIKEEIAASPPKVEHHFHTTTEVRYVNNPPWRWVPAPYVNPYPTWVGGVVGINGNSSGHVDLSKVTYTGVGLNTYPQSGGQISAGGVWNSNKVIGGTSAWASSQTYGSAGVTMKS